MTAVKTTSVDLTLEEVMVLFTSLNKSSSSSVEFLTATEKLRVAWGKLMEPPVMTGKEVEALFWKHCPKSAKEYITIEVVQAALNAILEASRRT